jgi:hypothetical protein
MAEFYELVNSELEEIGELDNSYSSSDEIVDDLEEVRADYRKKAGGWSGGSLTLLGTSAASGAYGAEFLGELATAGTAVAATAAVLGGLNAYRHKEKMLMADEYISELESDNPDKSKAREIASMLEPRR